MKKITSFILTLILCVTPFVFFGCGKEDEERYKLTVNGSEYLYSKLSDTYKAGEEVSVKVKITPYEGVKALLDDKALVKSKSDQDDFWLFTFKMPSRNATLDISSYKGFEEPFLLGFHITFKDKDGNPIEELSKDLNESGAVYDYYVREIDENGIKAFSENIGADVFAEGKSSLKNGNEISLECTLYFTYELLGATAVAHWVFYDEKTEEFTTAYEIPMGFRLDDIGTSSMFCKQNLSDIRYDGQMKEYEEKFISHIEVKSKYVDYLTGVKVLEFDKNNQLIQTSDFGSQDTSNSQGTIIASEDCEYVIIEEEYTVMNDEERKGEKYYERTLINKSKWGDHKTLKFPRGDGLISPVHLYVTWKETESE